MESVALKVLLPRAGQDQQQRQAMRHEYRVGRKLDHPRVLGPRDMGQAGGTAYLVMELYPGTNLREVASQRAAWTSLLPQIVREAAEGLAYLHQQGWAHCDIKPDNYLISPTGEVRLIDFAMAERPRRWFGWLAGKRRNIQGTRSYISPEQIRRRPADFRSDVYSFGCMLYHLLAGQPPYSAGSSTELLNKHLRAAPPRLDAANPQVAPEFATLVERMMAKRLADRPGSMARLLLDLAELPVLVSPDPEPARTEARQ